MINSELKKVLRCVKCKKPALIAEEKFLICKSCHAHYLIHNNVPSLLINDVKKQKWNPIFGSFIHKFMNKKKEWRIWN